jgi:hypothetical protein
VTCDKHSLQRHIFDLSSSIHEGVLRQVHWYRYTRVCRSLQPTFSTLLSSERVQDLLAKVDVDPPSRSDVHSLSNPSSAAGRRYADTAAIGDLTSCHTHDGRIVSRKPQ